MPLKLVPCDDQDDGRIALPNPIPPQLWQHMAEAHAELRDAAGV